MKSIFWKSWHWRCNGYLDYSLFQDPRQLGPLNWESAKTKWNGRKLKRDWAAEPVIIFFKRPVPVYQLLVDPALWLVRFDRLYQHSQSGSFLSLRKMVCGVRAREIEKYTIISVLNEMFTRFPAHRSVEEGTEDLPCELGARKKYQFCLLLSPFLFVFFAPPTFRVPFTFASSPLSESLEQATSINPSIRLKKGFLKPKRSELN